MTFKLQEAYNVAEDVLDKNVKHGKSLENMGVRRHEIKDAESFLQALQQVVSQSSFALKSLQQIGKRISPNIDVNQYVDKIMRSFSDIKREYVTSSQKNVSREPEDLRTGYADDPNDATRGTKHPYRGYRSG